MTTGKTTKAKVLTLAKQKHGKTAFLEERPHAKTPEQRAAATQRLNALRDEIVVLDKRIAALPGTRAVLLKAAEFALDVDGDEPSWSQLQEAVAKAKEVDALQDRRKECVNEQRKIGSHWQKRYTIYTNGGSVGGIGFQHTHESGDTLEEVFAKLEGKP